MRLGRGGVAARIATIDAYRFPAGVRHRLSLAHASLSDQDIGTVESAARQWFRIAARRPRAALAMPSVLVDELVRMAPDFPVRRGTDLRRTLILAQRDEDLAPAGLPLLFRVDQQIGIPGGRHYLADCGGRGECFELAGAVCLRHLDGPGRRPPGGGPRRPKIDPIGDVGGLGV